jgi:hypothetical protein
VLHGLFDPLFMVIFAMDTIDGLLKPTDPFSTEVFTYIKQR